MKFVINRMEIDFLWIEIHSQARHSQRNAFDVKINGKNSKKLDQSFVFQLVLAIQLDCNGLSIDYMLVGCVFFSQSFAIDGIGRAMLLLSMFRAMRWKLCGWKFSYLYNVFTLFSYIFGCCCYFIFSQFFIAIKRKERKMDLLILYAFI